jgi:osmotically-inducible protein OsmY
VEVCRSRKRLRVDTRCAPVDAFEDPQPRLAHANQVVAAIKRSADSQIGAVQRCLSIPERRGVQRRVVATDQDDAVKAFGEVAVEGVSQRIGQTLMWLLDEINARWYNLAQHGRVSARMDQCCSLPVELHRQVERVEQEPTVKRCRLVGRERRDQPSLGSPRDGCLANNEQRTAHPAGQRSTAFTIRVLVPGRTGIGLAVRVLGGTVQSMSELSPNAALTRRLEQQLAEAGFQVTVEQSDGSLILSGIVSSEESRQAVADIVADGAPNARIDNQLDIESVLPTDIDDFASDGASAEMADSADAIRAELEPDFEDSPGLSDPVAAAGAESSNSEDPASEGEVYTPPIDPVVTTDAHGAARVLGGFELDSFEDTRVDRSAMDRAPGDEALADAIRRELAEDSATTDLNIYVAVRNGVAHLRGQVADMDDADNAESVAARVPGVREVVEELEVSGI